MKNLGLVLLGVGTILLVFGNVFGIVGLISGFILTKVFGLVG